MLNAIIDRPIIEIGAKEEETINITPTQESQVILPSPNKTIGKVNVEPISSDYVKPSGELLITSSGKYNVRNYESVNAELTPVLVSIPIDSNRWLSDTSLYPYNQKAVVSVNLGELTTNSTIQLINDNESEGIFAKYGFFASTANDTSITIFAIDKPLTDIILKAEIIYGQGESGTPIIINPVSIVRKDKLVDINNNTAIEILPTDLEGVTQIRANMFSGNTNLLNIELPKTITIINNSAFSGCSGLTNVKLPNSVKNIGEYAFNSCSRLIDLQLPDSLTNIGQYAFANCSSLENISIPDSVITLGSYAFTNCGKLKNVNIGTGISTINVRVFNGCSQLTKIVFSNNIKHLVQFAFQFCSQLKKVVIGSGIKQIDANTFNSCNALTEFIINKPCTTASDVPTLASGNGIPTTCTIYVPDTTTQALFQSATNWNVYTIKLISELEE